MDIRPPNNKRPVPGVQRRQNRRRMGDFQRVKEIRQAEIKEGRSLPQAVEEVKAEPFQLDTSDIDDKKDSAEKKSLWLWFKPSYFRRNFSPRLFFKRLGLIGGTLLLFAVGYLGFKLFFAAQNIIDRDSGGALALQGDPSLLNGEGDGRVNILLIGVGGERHAGGDLADTIVIASLDPFNKEVAMLSVPRDLWVDIPGYRTAKINEAHSQLAVDTSGFNRSGYPEGGPGLLQKTLEDSLGVPIHYYARVDFNGFTQAVDAVGTINVNVPEAICDYKIGWEYGFNCLNAGEQEFDSEEALFFARTRASTRGDFDRGERQRILLMALKDEVLSTGTYSDPVRIGNLLDSAGNHARTNLQINEMLRVYELVNEIPADKFVSSGLDDYVTTANIGGISAVTPIAGNYEEIKRYVRSIFVDGMIKQEAATIDVLNGTPSPGLANETAATLESYGYNIVTVGDAPQKGYSATRLYAVNAHEAPVTQRYLEQRFSTIALGAGDLPDGVESDAAFVIILGNDATR